MIREGQDDGLGVEMGKGGDTGIDMLVKRNMGGDTARDRGHGQGTDGEDREVEIDDRESNNTTGKSGADAMKEGGLGIWMRGPAGEVDPGLHISEHHDRSI